jgi:hypothetical protein
MRAPDKPTIRRSPGRPRGTKTARFKRHVRLFNEPNRLAAAVAVGFIDKCRREGLRVTYKMATDLACEYPLDDQKHPPAWEAVYDLVRRGKARELPSMEEIEEEIDEQMLRVERWRRYLAERRANKSGDK